jgi:hypothetical protein
MTAGSFAKLQAATDSRSSQDLVYFVFDLLFLNGKDLMAVPLIERKERLRALLGSAPRPIQYSHHHIGDGGRDLDAACAAKAEGIISKRTDARYVPGNRGLWRKSKCVNREEFVIVGYSDPEGSRPYFGRCSASTPTGRTCSPRFSGRRRTTPTGRPDRKPPSGTGFRSPKPPATIISASWNSGTETPSARSRISGAAQSTRSIA